MYRDIKHFKHLGTSVARRFNPLTLQPIDTSTLNVNVKYSRHVNPSLVFIIFNP